MSNDTFYLKKLNRIQKLNKYLNKGCNTYGSFFSFTPQVVNINDGFIFEKHINIKNIHHLYDSPNIKFLNSGIFVINLIMHLSDSLQIGLFNNGILIEGTVRSTNMITNNICIHEILIFNESDVLSIRNYNSNLNKTISTVPSNTEFINTSQTLDLTIWKIGESNNNSSPEQSSDDESTEESSEESDKSSEELIKDNEESNKNTFIEIQSEDNKDISNNNLENSESSSDESSSYSSSASSSIEYKADEENDLYKIIQQKLIFDELKK